MADGEPSYIDYEAFLDPEFSPASFANTLVVATNNATDTPLDLSTPLSRVLFDLQEIDTHIHALTTKSALPLLTHTRDQTAAAGRILKEAEEQIASVTQGYERLEGKFSANGKLPTRPGWLQRSRWPLYDSHERLHAVFH